jgi:drug/metabolite transporter (DMT)-like permease
MGVAALSSSVSSPVLAATLVAACAHASWNAIAHRIPAKLASLALISLGSLACAIPLILAAGVPDRRCWPYLAVSAALHVAYNGVLMLSYRLGDFSQAYPLARGTSPLVVTGLAAVFAAETPGAGQLAGVLAISAGLGILVFWGYRRRPGRPAGLLAAFATGLLIAGYTTVDGLGVRLSGTVPGYAGWLMLAESAATAVAVGAWRGGRLWTDVRGVWHIGLLGGALSVLGYGLVLWAQTRGALASVAALRESSIILGALTGTLLFGERFGVARVLATLCVAAGIATIYLA